ncbi:HAD family phosphatase [candidate division KSB1 bacterium]|nr:HAD family phosphatase [candidate division KSB1 bacterium]
MKKFEAILFDLDGVIINSESLWDESSRIILKGYGFEYRRAEIKHLCTGKTLLESSKIIQEFYQLPIRIEELARTRKKMVTALYHEKLGFVDGFLDFIQIVINKKIPVAVATSSQKDLLELVTQKLNLVRFFQEHIYTIDTLSLRSKPAPDIFLHAARQLKLPAESCIVIEDAPYGVQAAKNARMYCIGLIGTNSADKLQGADLIVQRYDELIRIFESFAFEERR